MNVYLELMKYQMKCFLYQKVQQSRVIKKKIMINSFKTTINLKYKLMNKDKILKNQ